MKVELNRSQTETIGIAVSLYAAMLKTRLAMDEFKTPAETSEARAKCSVCSDIIGMVGCGGVEDD